jgi:Tfp pilus assembly protein FimT
MIKLQDSKSFTLIELLIIVGITLLLATITGLAFQTFQRESNLANNTEEVINLLRVAKSKTIASEGALNYGVHLESDKFVLFQGTVYDPLDTNNETHNLSQRVEIYEINLTGGGSEVVFDRITGMTSQDGNVSLRLKADPSRTRIIYVQGSGQVGLISPSIPPDTDRVKDSRHVHFDLGWSIQNATTLKFDFVDASQIETVSMAIYFNGDKSIFDWEETFSVGGTDQEFKVHTHFLDPTNTILSIHRDRNDGKNTEKVIIYIVDGSADKDIVTYLADVDDTVQKGFYVNTMEKQ